MEANDKWQSMVSLNDKQIYCKSSLSIVQCQEEDGTASEGVLVVVMEGGVKAVIHLLLNNSSNPNKEGL